MLWENVSRLDWSSLKAPALLGARVKLAGMYCSSCFRCYGCLSYFLGTKEVNFLNLILNENQEVEATAKGCSSTALRLNRTTRVSSKKHTVLRLQMDVDAVLKEEGF